MSIRISFDKIWNVFNYEFNANFLTVLGLYHFPFDQKNIGVGSFITYYYTENSFFHKNKIDKS